MEPEDYTYKLPSDYTMKPEHRAKLDKFVREYSLTNDEAQGLVDLHVELVEEYAALMRQAMCGLVITTFIISCSISAAIGATLFLIF